MRMQEQAKRISRAEQKVRTRDRLLAAAGRVIGRRGLGAASVDEISDDAGFSSGAFYSNFESKDEVFAAALRYHAEELARFLEAHGRTGSARRRLSADAEWLAALDDWQILFWMEIVAQSGRSERLRPVVRDYLAAARQRVAEELERGAQESASGLPRPAADLATLFVAAEVGLFVQRLFEPEAVRAELLADLAGLMAN